MLHKLFSGCRPESAKIKTIIIIIIIMFIKHPENISHKSNNRLTSADPRMRLHRRTNNLVLTWHVH